MAVDRSEIRSSSTDTDVRCAETSTLGQTTNPRREFLGRSLPTLHFDKSRASLSARSQENYESLTHLRAHKKLLYYQHTHLLNSSTVRRDSDTDRRQQSPCLFPCSSTLYRKFRKKMRTPIRRC